MKDTYRERIKEEQKKLSPQQVFFSEGYQRLFQHLADEVAGEKLEQLLLYQNASDGIAGWNDGKRIGINVDNTITGSFLELEQKSDSLVGILGHECGHARFTDSRLRRVYIQKMQAGTWYPDAPKPENEDEESALAEMNTYLTKKDPAVLSLLTECASYISNLLNDVYIEAKMCSLFPGSIKKGILVNRRRNEEWIPPLKELLEGNPDPVSVFLKVLVQYALRGYVNSWNMESCEMLDTLNEVKQLVDLSVEADSDLIRYKATNRILLKMWKYFRKLLEELKQECQEPEENGEQQQETQEQPPEKETPQEEPPGKESSDEPSEKEKWKAEAQENGCGEELTEEQQKKMESAMGKYLKALTENLPAFIQESEAEEKALPDIENARVIQVSKRIEDQKESTDEKSELIFQKILFQLVEGTVDQKIGLEVRNRLQKEVDGMKFDAAHDRVKKEILYKNVFTEAEKKFLPLYEAAVKRTEKRLRVRFLPILENQKERTEHRMFFGKRLDMRTIADPGGAVYKRTFQGKKTDAAVCVLVDNSDSMMGQRMEAAKAAALTLYDFCRKAGIPVLVYGHHTDGYSHNNPSEETVYFHSCAEFAEDRNDRLRITTMETCGSNRDGAALLFVANKLLNRPEKHKMLFLISDGLPNATCYSGSYAMADLRKIKEKLVKKGIVFQAAAIGWDKKAIQEIYGNAYLDISDLGELPVRLTKQLAKLLRRAN